MDMAEAAKHTAGPWFCSGRADESGTQYDIGLGVWPHGDLANAVHGCRGDEYMQVGGICSEADARLIAAAPDLLEALMGLTQWASFDAGTVNPTTSFWDALDTARAAIVKATSQQLQASPGNRKDGSSHNTAQEAQS